MSLRERTVLVSGASRGIGRATVERLLDDGAKVIGLARTGDNVIEHEHYRHYLVDLSDLMGAATTLQTLARELSEVNALVSNVGAGHFGGLEQFSAEQVCASIDLNLTSHIILVRAFLPCLKRHQFSDVILMGSESALQGGRKGTLYCAAKFGLRGFSQSLRLDCSSSGVRVTLVNPGMVRTSFFDEQSFRPGSKAENAIEASEVAGVVSDAIAARPGLVFDEINLSPLKKVVEFERGKAE